MSTKQTDSAWDFQRQIFTNFDEMVSGWFDGSVDFDEVEEELQRLQEDEDVLLPTYKKCQELWGEAQLDDSMWQDEEYKKWSQLERDQA